MAGPGEGVLVVAALPTRREVVEGGGYGRGARGGRRPFRIYPGHHQGGQCEEAIVLIFMAEGHDGHGSGAAARGGGPWSGGSGARTSRVACGRGA